MGKLRVYIACPVSKGDLLSNIRQADRAMAELMRHGFAPFNPALSCYAGGAAPIGEGCVVSVAHSCANGEFREFGHAAWVDMDLAWVEAADAVLRLPGESAGADRECAFAHSVGKSVYFSVNALLLDYPRLVAEG